MIYSYPLIKNKMGGVFMKIWQQEKENVQRCRIRPGSVEGVIIVNGRPQVERADMPLAFSFDSIENLELFCNKVKK